jgi:hypothetical protein
MTSGIMITTMPKARTAMRTQPIAEIAGGFPAAASSRA